jgi:hypothetical protein
MACDVASSSKEGVQPLVKDIRPKKMYFLGLILLDSLRTRSHQTSFETCVAT